VYERDFYVNSRFFFRVLVQFVKLNELVNVPRLYIYIKKTVRFVVQNFASERLLFRINVRRVIFTAVSFRLFF